RADYPPILYFMYLLSSHSCPISCLSFFFTDPPTTEIYTLSLHDALPIFAHAALHEQFCAGGGGVKSLEIGCGDSPITREDGAIRSEEHTSELQSRGHLVCRLLLEKKKKIKTYYH